MPPDWISTAEAAELLGVSRRQVQISLSAGEREQEWGAENVGWRRKPLARRTIYQVNRAVVAAKLAPPDAS